MENNPYSPPSRAPDAEDTEAQRGPTALITGAGLAGAAAGIVQAVGAAQVVSMVYFQHAWQSAWVWTVCVCGVVAIVTGFGYSQARAWALWSSLICATIAAIAGWSWVVYAFMHGFFTMAMLVGAGLGSLAVMLMVLSFSAAKRVARARAALYGDADAR